MSIGGLEYVVVASAVVSRQPMISMKYRGVNMPHQIAVGGEIVYDPALVRSRGIDLQHDVSAGNAMNVRVADVLAMQIP